jgi:RNA-dependent RNA polymerase
MLCLHPDPSTDHDTKPRVWIRASQVKILVLLWKSLTSSMSLIVAQYTPEISALPENRIIDLVRCSQMRINCRINTQVMINLAENTAKHERGRMVDIFKNLINATFKEIISTFSVVDDKDALLRLCSSIEKSSSAQRQLRHLARGARARGLIHDHKTEPWVEDEGLSEGEDSAPESAAWWPDPISGLPSTLEETVISLLASGFTPKDTAILRVKLLEIFKSAVRRQARPPKFYCTLQESCYGVLIPGALSAYKVVVSINVPCSDPLGILQPGEIFVRSSRPFKIIRDGVEHSCNILTGPVLVRVLLLEHALTLHSYAR